MYLLTIYLLQTRGERLDGRVSMLLAMTPAMIVKLLQAIFVPIVHKTSLKSGDGGKALNKSLIVKQLLIYSKNNLPLKTIVFAHPGTLNNL